MEKIETRGLPCGVCSRRSRSSGSPSSQASKPGEATDCSAPWTAEAILGGEERIEIHDADARKCGGDSIWPDDGWQVQIVALLPGGAKMMESRLCSRLWMGSAS